MSVTLRELEVFLEVARHLHFGRAADALYLSQPVVSQELRRLERKLGVSLFDRSTRSVRLTSQGETLAEAARTVCEARDDFITLAQQLTPGRMDTVRVAATPSVVDRILPRVLRRVEQEMPGIIVEEHSVETGEIPDALAHGCDIGIGRFLTLDQRFRVEDLTPEPIHVALSRDHPGYDEAGIRLHELADVPLLLWPRDQNPGYYDFLLEVCAAGGLEPLVLISRPRIIGARTYLIAEGRAFALIPESTARNASDDIATCPIIPTAELPLSVTWRKADNRSSIAQFISVVRQVSAAGEFDPPTSVVPSVAPLGKESR